MMERLETGRELGNRMESLDNSHRWRLLDFVCLFSSTVPTGCTLSFVRDTVALLEPRKVSRCGAGF
jgi:hypothetical protein